jgi:hypothetical protein
MTPTCVEVHVDAGGLVGLVAHLERVYEVGLIGILVYNKWVIA